MSLGARVLIAIVAALFGAMLLFSAGSGTKGLIVDAAAGFCFALAIACVARGRVAAFSGSVVAMGILVAGVSYLVSMVREGVLVFGRRNRPSALNAVLFLIVFGVPAAAYLWHARFGFPRPETPDVPTDELYDDDDELSDDLPL